MIALLEYPQGKDNQKIRQARGRITPYLKRYHLTTRHLTLVEGSPAQLDQFEVIVLRNGGKIVMDVRIVTPDRKAK